MRWMLTKRTSPVTGEPFAHSALTLNRALRNLISDTCCAAATGSASDGTDAPDEAVVSKKRAKSAYTAIDASRDDDGTGSSSSCGKKHKKMKRR
eukprot:3665708-Prymnesium_polylepis.1